MEFPMGVPYDTMVLRTPWSICSTVLEYRHTRYTVYIHISSWEFPNIDIPSIDIPMTCPGIFHGASIQISYDTPTGTRIAPDITLCLMYMSQCESSHGKSLEMSHGTFDGACIDISRMACGVTHEACHGNPVGQFKLL